jgi:PAS domain S-box-containing protein
MSDVIEKIKELNAVVAQFQLDPSTYERIVDKLGEGLVVVDSRGIIVLVNEALQLMFGYDRSQLLGQPVHKLLPPELAGMHEQHIRTFFKRPSTRPMNFARPLQGRHQNGDPVTVQISLAPVMDPRGIVVVAIVKSVADAT